MTTTYAPDMRPVNPSFPERGVLRADEFYTFDALMTRLPEGTAREAIRRLVKEKALAVYRIGKFTWFYGAEVIAASRVGGDDSDFEE